MKRDLQPAAREDIQDQADFIAVKNEAASERFLDAVEASIRFLSENPRAGALRRSTDPDLHALRMWPIRGFDKHLIFYRASDNLLEIVRVLHSSRDIDSILEG